MLYPFQACKVSADIRGGETTNIANIISNSDMPNILYVFLRSLKSFVSKAHDVNVTMTYIASIYSPNLAYVLRNNEKTLQEKILVTKFFKMGILYHGALTWL